MAIRNIFSLVSLSNDQDEEDSDVEEVEEEGEEKLSDYWSVLKSTPELRKSKVLFVNQIFSSSHFSAGVIYFLVK